MKCPNNKACLHAERNKLATQLMRIDLALSMLDSVRLLVDLQDEAKELSPEMQELAAFGDGFEGEFTAEILTAVKRHYKVDDHVAMAILNRGLDAGVITATNDPCGRQFIKFIRVEKLIGEHSCHTPCRCRAQKPIKSYAKQIKKHHDEASRFAGLTPNEAKALASAKRIAGKNDEFFTSSFVEQTGEFSEAYCWNLLNSLVKKGKLKRLSRGHYCVL